MDSTADCYFCQDRAVTDGLVKPTSKGLDVLKNLANMRCDTVS